MDNKIIYESKAELILLLIVNWGFVIISMSTGYIWGLLFFGLCAVVTTYPLLDPSKKLVFRSTKTYNERLVDFGLFLYSDDGFQITIGKVQNVIKWSNIQAIFAYKVDHYTEDEICLDVFCDNGISFKISEEIAGWYVFIDKMAIQFPNIQQNWSFEIAQPAFETNFTLLYDREKRTLEQASNIFYSGK